MGNTIRYSAIFLFLFVPMIWASGGYDNGTSTGKGKLQLDFTWNPLDLIQHGQTYTVVSYGMTDQLDLHGFLSHHTRGFETWYMGIFYQFLNHKLLDLATAIGIRRRFDEDWTHLFFPQMLYTIHVSEYIYFGGSLVNLIEGRLWNNVKSIGVALDFAIFYKIQYQSKLIESVAVGFGGFHPATYNPGRFFLPTYSIDIKFKRFYKSK